MPDERSTPRRPPAGPTHPAYDEKSPWVTRVWLAIIVLFGLSLCALFCLGLLGSGLK